MATNKTWFKRQEVPLCRGKFRTSCVSIFIRLNIFANSFTKAILISRCEFSITFVASATLIVELNEFLAVITDLYNSSTFTPISGVEPDVTFNIFSTVCSLSPGFILSGEYPAKSLH